MGCVGSVGCTRDKKNFVNQVMARCRAMERYRVMARCKGATLLTLTSIASGDLPLIALKKFVVAAA